MSNQRCECGHEEDNHYKDGCHGTEYGRCETCGKSDKSKASSCECKRYRHHLASWYASQDYAMMERGFGGRPSGHG